MLSAIACGLGDLLPYIEFAGLRSADARPAKLSPARHGGLGGLAVAHHSLLHRRWSHRRLARLRTVWSPLGI